MTSTLTPPPKPRGLLKWAFLLPRSLYRWHLGWLLGHHFMMMTHVGRKTGVIRQMVVEAVNYDPKTQTCQALAGWGERTDWYRNLQAHPALEIQVGSRRYVPQQHFLSTEELLALLQDYEHRHPRGLRLLFRHLGYPYDGSPEGLQAIAQVIRGVEFRPEAEKRITSREIVPTSRIFTPFFSAHDRTRTSLAEAARVRFWQRAGSVPGRCAATIAREALLFCWRLPL